jgi:hypothetical protein
VTYSAPELSTQDTISVTDSGGRSATARVDVSGDMRLSPATHVATGGEKITFSLYNASGNINWLVLQGDNPVKTGDQSYQYTAPAQTGRYIVSASDDRGQQVQSVVYVISDNLSVSPTQLSMSAKESQFLSVVRGEGPYTWSTEMGVLSANSGNRVYISAPDVMAETAFNVTVEDSLGNVAVAQIMVKPNSDTACKLTSNQPDYRNGDNLTVSISPPGCREVGVTYYAAITLPVPDLPLFMLTGLNNIVPLEGAVLPQWQGNESVLELPVIADYPRGVYTLYLLPAPAGSDPLLHLDKLEIGGFSVLP